MTGEELKTLLKRKGISQTKLAQELGISKNLLFDRLRARTLKNSFLEQIEDALGEPLIPNTSEFSQVPYTLYKEVLDENKELQRKIAVLEYRLQEKEKEADNS